MAFPLALYGADQYITQYDYEIGPPWNAKAWETYQRIPIRSSTPIGSRRRRCFSAASGLNVPVQGGQQMYQALRSLGVETQLVIYPNENHGISRPATCATGTSGTWRGTRST